MNPVRLNLGARSFEAKEYRLPNFEVSWAGECPWNQGLCFGSEDGRLEIITEDDRFSFLGPFPVNESGEAVNGVAFVNNMMAVSSRADVVFWKSPENGMGEPEAQEFEGGAHGIVATSSGRFAAPMGPGGLLYKDSRLGDPSAIRVLKPTNKEFNFYKSINLYKTERGDILACAGRRGGLAAVNLSPSGTDDSIRSLTFPGLDVIDVCSLGSKEFPFAVAALGVDRSLHLIRNVISDGHPQTLRFDSLHGGAYRVLSAQGHLFLLTSQWIYALANIASKFLGGQRLDEPTTVFEAPIQAVDANLAFDRRLLIVLSDSVLSIDITGLTASDYTSSPSSNSAESNFPNFNIHNDSAILTQPHWDVFSGHELATIPA